MQKITTLWVSPTILDVDLHKTALLDISEHLELLGHKTCIVAVRSRSNQRNENPQVHTISVPLRCIPLISRIMYSVTLLFLLPILLVFLRPDFVIMEPDVSTLSSIPTILISKFKRVKFVLDIRSTPVEIVGFRGSLQKIWFSVSVLIAKKLFDGMTIITPLMKKEVCRRFNIDPAKVGVWTSGVTDSLFNPQNLISESAELKRKLGLTGKFVVFYHGVFSATRGLQETIKAIEILKHRHFNAVLFLLGKGPIIANLKALIQKEDLQDNVIIHNPIDHLEVPKFIGISDVCILPLPDHPYWRFQSPLKLLEYLAMEKVVVLTDIPAHRTVIGEAKCGVYISSVNPMEIAKAIEYVYLNKDSLKERGKIGREIVKREYTWEKVAADLENYLLSIDELRKKK